MNRFPVGARINRILESECTGRTCTQKENKLPVSPRCDFNEKMSPLQSAIVTFLLGGIGYGLVELIWRGETHWSMVLTGGACLLAICRVCRYMRKKSVFLCSAVCAAAITAVEFAVGAVVNLWWGMEVWDYSSLFGNLFGQICPLYSFLWFLLCIPVCTVAKKTCKSAL